MPKIWQNMKKILVQLALCPFFGWFRIIPKNFEFEYPIHHLFRLLEINFWKLVVQNSNKFWKLKFPKWRSIYYNTIFYNIVHIFFKNLSELFYNTKKNHIFFLSLKGNRTPEELAQPIPCVEDAQTEALEYCGDWKSQERDGRSRTRLQEIIGSSYSWAVKMEK